MTTTTKPILSPNAETILKKRYLQEGEDAEGLFWRVARAVALGERGYQGAEGHPADTEREVGAVDKWAATFYELMASLKFLPNSPTLVNAGLGERGCLSACFVISPEDTMESIMAVAHDAAMVEKWGGGIGFGLSKLRPKGDKVSTVHGQACGPVAVMKLYSTVGATLTQGSFRLGAHMAQLHVSHPDIQEFIHAKDGDDALQNFNISVQVTDAFMKAVQQDWLWRLSNPRDEGSGPIDEAAGDISAKKLWDEIVDSAWRTGDPGVVFMDRVWETAPNPHLGRIESSNPCAEEFLEDYGNCCLGSINLDRHVELDHFDWNLLAETVQTAVRFLDDVIEVNEFPLPELREMNLKTRRIGLGVMGWADALVRMGIPYDSEEALGLAEEVGGFIERRAWEMSMALAAERGAYPAYEGSRVQELALARKAERTANLKHNEFEFESPPPIYRHSSVTTIAPTGCQVGSTLVVSDCGLLRLDELDNGSEDQWQLLNLSVQQEGRRVPATKFYRNGYRPTKVISLSSGILLQSTPNHRYRAFVGEGYQWIRADELQPLDRVAVVIGGYDKADEQELLPLPDRGVRQGVKPKKVKTPTQLTPDLAYFLGVYCANGSLHKKGIRIHFGDHLTGKIKQVADLGHSLFGLKPGIRRERTCTSIYFNSVSLVSWLAVNGLVKEKSLTAVIPKAVRASSAKALGSFIDGLYLGDGSRTGNTKYIDTASSQLAQELAVALRAMGVNVRIQKYERVKGRKSQLPSYRVYFKKFGSQGAEWAERYVNKRDREFLAHVRDLDPSLFWDEVAEVGDGEAETFDIEVPDGNAYVANSAVSHNTISRIAGVSSGIEPHFALAWYSNVLWEGDEDDGLGRAQARLLDMPSALRERAADGEFIRRILEEAADGKIDQNELAARGLDHIRTTHEISPEAHVKMQAAWQKHTTNGVSKTINLPNSATKEDVGKALWLAWESGCKAVTVYRDGSKGQQVLETGKPKWPADGAPAPAVKPPLGDETYPADAHYHGRKKLPDTRPAIVHHFSVGGTEGYLHVGLHPDQDPAVMEELYRLLRRLQPGELFLTTSKQGSTIDGLMDAVAIQVSLALQHGVPLQQLTDKMKGRRFEPSGLTGNKDIPTATSLIDYIFRYLEREFVAEGERVTSDNGTGMSCPDCGAVAIAQEGCLVCVEGCGWQKC